MKQEIITLIATVIFVALLAACGSRPESISSNSANKGARVVIALKPDKNPDQMIAERGSLEKYLSEKLGKPVEIIIPLSAAVINEGFANGTIDIGYLSANDLINAKDAELLLVGEINGKTTYKSYWLSLKEKPYTKIEDLKGKPVAFASKTSTSGFIIPLWDLRKRNLISEKADPEEFFGAGNVFFGTGYVSAVERVLNGQSEAAAVSYYVLDENKHLTEEQRSKLKKVQEQGDVPTHIIAVRKTLTGEERNKLRQALLSLNDPANTELRDKLFTSKLVEADQQEHLRPLKEALSIMPK
ncbi:phosphate/phosphite/phosphonate ABC transporter substrate-binding protein [Leptolyngbya sp. 7M]|uniref:phosphate/phosphite/phosphonate ABC transporter substrate-binding protein n=1 Tax=Leptolyngbya sp. 7M TaxID=2812896 RepID=UPI001B8D82F0|nr:phosphate/phosphite/phosphonate ABC transporter substrate-binding protein [Leptolyngbya sp. 7M]QYO66072.1 phosphate/phosphite/phosphonate ABC transporter substrate-binding protein [Leptolyngbya sp. 7M]